MSAIAHAEILDTTGATHTGDTNWTTAATLASTNFVANAKYLLIGNGQFKGTNNAVGIGVRVADGATPTALVGSTERVEVHGSVGDATGYSFATVYTAPATAVAVVMQMKTFDAAETVEFTSANIIVMRLDADLTENTDWYFNEDNDEGAPVAHTTTPVAFATVTFTPGNAGDDWLILGHSAHDINNIALNVRVSLDRDAGTEVVPQWEVEGENIADTFGSNIMRVYNLTAASHTFALHVEDDGSGTQNDHSSSRIIAINLSKFEQNMAASWNVAEVAQTTDVWTELATASVTPTTAGGDWLFMGFAAADSGGSGRKHSIRMQNDAVTFPAGTDGVTELRSTAMDSTDEPPLFVAGLVSLASGAHTMDLDGSTASGTGGPIEDRAFAGFSMELAAAAGTTITPGTAALVATGLAPVVTVSDNQLVTPATETLVASGFAPVVTASDHQIVTPGLVALVAAGLAPTASVSDNQLVTPSLATLVASGLAPVVSVSDNQLVTPSLVALVASGLAPSVATSANQLVTPDTAALVASGLAPVVTATAHQTVTPDTVALVAAGLAPTVSIGVNQLVTPATAPLVALGLAPVVSVSDNQSVTPAKVALVASGLAPTVLVSDNQLITPAAATLVASGLAPVVSLTGHQTITPATAALVASGLTPAITATGQRLLVATVIAQVGRIETFYVAQSGAASGSLSVFLEQVGTVETLYAIQAGVTDGRVSVMIEQRGKIETQIERL